MERIDWTDELIERMRELAVSGLSYHAIAAELGISKNAVIGKCHRLNIVSQHVFKPGGERKGQRRGVLQIRRPRTPLPPLPLLVPVHDAPKPVIAAPQKTAPTPFLARKSEPCCWPIGTPRTPEFRYCDEPSIGDKPYCLAHYSIAYVSAPAREAPSGGGFGRLTRVFGG